MGINNIIVFTVAIILIASGIIQPSSADDFSLNKFVGVWYGIGVATSIVYSDVYTCYRFNITKQYNDDDDQKFYEVLNLKLNGDPVKSKGYGNVVDSLLHIRFLEEQTESISKVMSYDNGQELILHMINPIKPWFYGLISRSPTILAETKAKFERLAAGVKANVLYFGHDGCSYANRIF